LSFVRSHYIAAIAVCASWFLREELRPHILHDAVESIRQRYRVALIGRRPSRLGYNVPFRNIVFPAQLLLADHRRLLPVIAPLGRREPPGGGVLGFASGGSFLGKGRPMMPETLPGAQIALILMALPFVGLAIAVLFQLGRVGWLQHQVVRKRWMGRHANRYQKRRAQLEESDR
jgi:hypothetical protein